MCLQSAPLAGNFIFLNVTGHFNETLTPVCSILSSELLLNSLLTTEGRKIGSSRSNHTNYKITCTLVVICSAPMPKSPGGLMVRASD